MFHHDLLSENEAAVQRFLSSNYFASENLVTDPTTSSLTWERVHAGFAPVGMLAFVNNAVTSATRRSTMASCDTVISTLDDAVKALAADTSSAYARLERELIGDSLVVNAEVLETLHARTKERGDEYVGLKHATYRSAVNLGNGVHGEDYVTIETSGRDVDPDGFAFAFKMLRSVDVPGVFSHVDKLSGGRRGSVWGGSGGDYDTVPRRGNIHTFMLILSETKFTGLLRMQIWLDVDLPSNGHGIPVPMSSSFASIHDALSLGLRYRRVLERSFSASIKKDPAAPVSIYAAVNLTPMSRLRVTQCQVCERKLGLLTRKRYSCDVCKASLCGTCARTSDMCSWRICGCCYARNHGLFSRQIMSKLTSPFSRLSFFARRSSIAYRQSIANALPVRPSKSYGQPMAATITPYEPASSLLHVHEKESRRTSSSDSSSSTTASSSSKSLASSSSNPFASSSSNPLASSASNPFTSRSSNPLASSASNPFASRPSNPLANSSMSAFHPSSSELDQITELEDDQYEHYVPGTSYTDDMPLSYHGGVKLLDDTFLHRLSASSSQWDDEDSEEDIDNLDVDRFLERMSIDEGNELPHSGPRESYTSGRISFHRVL